ncbi:amino acid deaminase/aldolase [Naumannella sp. ID2617S]|nr:amino acid deaminase/aldolase [Naumannella sp. ID2617S]
MSEPWSRLDRAIAGEPTPAVVLDLAALRSNADELVRRAAGMPIRVTSKSVRVRRVLTEVLDRPGFAGLLTFTLAEALWLAEDHTDVVVGYPTADAEALRRLAADDRLRDRVALMVDSPSHLDWIDGVLGQGHPELRVCLELDVSYDLPGLRVGVWRSPVRSADDAGATARLIADRPGFRLVGLMAYEAQIAGLGDRPSGTAVNRARTLVIQRLQRRSWSDVLERRAAAVAAVRAKCELEFVNGGGTGSVHLTAHDPAVTEIAAGSGLFGPGLFDHYRAFRPEPALAFALSVVRRPAPGRVTVLGGGWIASGPPGRDRQPLPVWPAGLRLEPNEMAGEVQTPLIGPAADRLEVGDRVWFRHAKAGELAEHANHVLVVDGATVVDRWPTYRGEGRSFL